MSLLTRIPQYFNGFRIPSGYIVGRTELGHGPVHPISIDSLMQSAAQPVAGGGSTNNPQSANPTATAGPAAVNGTAATFMTSDSAPAVQLLGSAQAGLAPASGGGTTNFLRADLTWAAPPGSGGSPAFHPGFASGQFYDSPLLGGSPGTSLFSANTLYALPFYVGATTTFTKTQWRISGAGSGNYEIGIYNNAAGVPTTLKQDLGSNAVVGSALNLVTGLTITLAAGWYWLVIAWSAASGSGVYSIGTVDATFLTGASDPNGQWNGIPTGAWTYSAGNLPANFPAITRNTSVPRVQLGL